MRESQGWIYEKPPGSGFVWIGYRYNGKDEAEAAWIDDPKALDGSGRRRCKVDGYEMVKGKRKVVSAEATKVLTQTLRRLDRGELVAPSKRTLTVNQLLDEFIVDRRSEGIKQYIVEPGRKIDEKEKWYEHGCSQADSQLKPVRDWFGKRPAAVVTSAEVNKYRNYRLSEVENKVSGPTINRGLEILKSAYNWAVKQSPPKLPHSLHIGMYDESKNARQGFLTDEQYYALLANLGRFRGRGAEKKFVPDEVLQDFLRWGVATGMRKGETSKLTWRMFDEKDWMIRLHAKAEKAGIGRTIPVGGTWKAIIERRRAAKMPGCPWIFHRGGKQVKDFDSMWRSAVKRAGLPEEEFGPDLGAGDSPESAEVLAKRKRRRFGYHDTRRTARRNLRKAKIDRAVIRQIGGFRTDSIDVRYNIVDLEDLREAVVLSDALMGEEKLPPPNVEQELRPRPKVVPLKGRRKAS